MRAHLSAVITHCVALKKFSFFPTIELPDYFWSVIGPSLEDLELLSRDRISGGILKAIQEHCRQVCRFTNFDIRSSESQFLSLLKSYGGQLKFAKAHFSVLQIEQLSPVAAECTNCAFEVLNMSPKEFPQPVTALQYRIHNLSIRT